MYSSSTYFIEQKQETVEEHAVILIFMQNIENFSQLADRCKRWWIDW